MSKNKGLRYLKKKSLGDLSFAPHAKGLCPLRAPENCVRLSQSEGPNRTSAFSNTVVFL